MVEPHDLSGTASPDKPLTVAPKPEHNLALGIVLITSAFLCAATMSALSKEAADIPASLILFLQYAISFVVFVPAALSQGVSRMRTEHLVLQIFRSVAGSVCQLLFFVAVRSIPLLVAVLLSNAAPLFIPIIVYIWFRKAVQPLVWSSLFIGLFGIILIIRPGPAMFHSPAALIALAAGVFSALALVATNRLAETEPPTRILVYNFGVSTLLLIPLCILSWKPLGPKQWFLLIGIGIFYAATQLLIILAYRHASASELSPFNYTVVIFSGLLGWWLFGSVPCSAALWARFSSVSAEFLVSRPDTLKAWGTPSVQAIGTSDGDYATARPRVPQGSCTRRLRILQILGIYDCARIPGRPAILNWPLHFTSIGFAQLSSSLHH